MKARRDSLTLDLFEVPVARLPLPGALNFGLQIRHMLNTEIGKHSNATRIAAQMSDLVGHTVSPGQVHNWTAPSREEIDGPDGKVRSYRFPLEYLPAFEVACETHAITAWLADVRGCKVLVGKEALDAEIGKLERLKEDAAKKIKQLKHAMGEME